jgi:hypothetical protein
MAVAELSGEADHVLTIIRRHAADEEPLSGDQLLKESGFDTDELREAIEELEKEGILDPDAEGFALSDGARPPAPAEDEHDEGSTDDDETRVMSLPPTIGVGAGDAYRVHLTLVGSFTETARGNKDDAALRRSEKLAARIVEVLGTSMPGLGFAVEIERVEALQTRVIFGAEAEPEEPEDEEEDDTEH